MDIHNPFEEISERLQRIENCLAALKNDRTAKSDPKEEKFITISEAASFLHLAVPTVYGLVHRSEIPVYKRNNRLYFSEVQLINWIKAGRRQTTQEIKQDAGQSLYSKDEKSSS